jgi:hypothetical protein
MTSFQTGMSGQTIHANSAQSSAASAASGNALISASVMQSKCRSALRCLPLPL